MKRIGQLFLALILLALPFTCGKAPSTDGITTSPGADKLCPACTNG